MPSGHGNSLGLGPVPRLRALGTTHSLPTVMRRAGPPPFKITRLASHAQGHLPVGCGVPAPHAATLQTEYLRKTVLRPEGTPRGAQQGTACRLEGSVTGRRCSENTGGTSPAISGVEADAIRQPSHLAPFPPSPIPSFP